MKTVWPVKQFGEIAEFKNGLNFSASERGDLIKIIGVSGFQEHFRISHQNLDQVEIEGAVPDGFLLKNRDLVFVRSNGSKALVGRCLLIENVTEPVTHSGFTIRARVTSRDVDSEFIGYFFQTSLARRAIATAGGGTNISNLSQELLAAIPVPVPKLAEQLEIAAIISTWERAVTTVEKLVAERAERKLGLMQKLLTGQTRFKEFKGERWRTHRLGDLFTERVEIGRTDLPLVAITGQNGVVPRDSLTKRDNSSEDKSKYLRIAPGDIGYNTMRMWQGVAGLSQIEGIVSPAYTICVPTGKIDGQFAAYLFKTAPMIHAFHRNSQGLVDDTLSLKYHNFARIHVTIPDVPEQKRIAAVLNACDEEIKLLQKQLDALKEQKRGLMQKLLTGEVRVKI